MIECDENKKNDNNSENEFINKQIKFMYGEYYDKILTDGNINIDDNIINNYKKRKEKIIWTIGKIRHVYFFYT